MCLLRIRIVNSVSYDIIIIREKLSISIPVEMLAYIFFTIIMQDIISLEYIIIKHWILVCHIYIKCTDRAFIDIVTASYFQSHRIITNSAYRWICYQRRIYSKSSI